MKSSGKARLNSTINSGGQQFVCVKHVRVNDGGQAIIGNVREDAKARAQRNLLRQTVPASISAKADV